MGCPAPALASYVPLTNVIVLPAHMVKHLSGESRKLTVTISVKLVGDPMTALNGGPFITMAEVFMA